MINHLELFNVRAAIRVKENEIATRAGSALDNPLDVANRMAFNSSLATLGKVTACGMQQIGDKVDFLNKIKGEF